MGYSTDRRKAARRELKREAIDYKGGACEACGYHACERALQFHHRDPSEKEFSLSGVSSFLKAKPELDKCALLCSNCHAEEHDRWERKEDI